MSPPRRYELAEDNRDGIDAVLTPAQIADVRRTGLVDVRLLDTGEARLLPQRRVGAVHVDGDDIVVTPKMGISRLLFLLGYSNDPGFRPEDVEGTPENDLWPAVAETVCRHTERALTAGVLQGYVTEDAATAVVRGRIRVSDQFSRRPGMWLPLECHYDDYTADIAENRILRAAIRRMIAVPDVATDMRMRLRHLDGRLEGVSPLNPGAPLPVWRPTRLNFRYHQALRMAELVLGAVSFDVGSGGPSIAAFVVDMAAVFENFVTTALREAWHGYPGATRGQYPTILDEAGTIMMKVDVVHVVDSVPRIFADAKYKLHGANDGRQNADHYQMLAYGTALGLDDAWLVYADDKPGRVSRRVRHTGITIHEYSLDLTSGPAQLIEQVTTLAEASWSHSDGATASQALSSRRPDTPRPAGSL